MSTEIAINTNELNEAPFGEISSLLRSPVVVDLLRVKPRVDLLRLAQLVISADSAGASLRFKSPGHQSPLSSPELAVAEWYGASSSRHGLDLPEIVYARDACTVVAAPSQLPLTSRLAFQAQLARVMIRVGIKLPLKLYAATATIAFEGAMNAEEHGCMRESEPKNPIRFIAACLRRSEVDAFPSIASEYLDAYLTAGHSKPRQWLELVVADAGVGIAYPSFRQFAMNAGRDEWDLYNATFAEELTRTQILLNSRLSTKGSWGRVVNRETAAGDGKAFIRLFLSAVRGFASLTAGRSQASCWYAKTHRSPEDLREMAGYEVSPNEQALIRGTIWQVIIPLDQQFELPLR